MQIFARVTFVGNAESCGKQARTNKQRSKRGTHATRTDTHRNNGAQAEGHARAHKTHAHKHMHTPARASARARAGTQKTDKQTRQTRGKENRLGLGAMILSIELPPKLPPLFALRPHPALPKCWRDGGVGAAMRRMVAVESEGIWAPYGQRVARCSAG